MSAGRVRELTARCSGGVSVLEVAGEGALERSATLLAGAAPAIGRLSLARLRLDGEEVDEILVWCESTQRVELHLHGSPPLVARLLARLRELGFEDGDSPDVARTLEQRALELVPFAPTAAGARMLLDQAEGALRAELTRLAGVSAPARRAGLLVLHRRAQIARRLLEPARVVLAGPVNAGKSTLFNALVGSHRALVSSSAGTTRDVICEPARVGDWPILLFDTAGERVLDPSELAQSIEAEGQALGQAARRAADVVLWLAPADLPLAPVPSGALLLLTRADLASDSGSRAGAAARLAAGPDPRGAAAQACEVLLRALGLPEQAHQPGVAVPFEPGMETLLERALALEDLSLLEELARER